MKKITYLLIILMVALIAACASKTEPVMQKVQNKRIIKRDLTKPTAVYHPIPSILEMKESSKQPVKLVEIKKEDNGVLPQIFIEFQNESSRLYSKSVLQDFMEKSNEESHIFLIGHSHGKSSVGTLNLASQRAETIKKTLNNQGFKNVHLMAAWSQTAKGFIPSRGVHLYAVDNIANNKGVPLVLVNKEIGNDNKSDSIPDMVSVLDVKKDV